jgi:transcriptional regulator with XRE-family HTH domain
MNDVVAKNIRALREHRGWTQEHLAQASDIDTRTVQRAEAGHGISSESLLAIAGALDVDLEMLRQDPREVLAAAWGVKVEEVTDELVQRKLEEAKTAFEAEYSKIELTRVVSSGDLATVHQAGALLLQCGPEDDAIRDLAAELEAHLMETIDVRDVLNATQKRDCEKEAFAIVRGLQERDCVVSIALQPRYVKVPDGSPLRLDTLFVIVAPTADAQDFAHVKKRLGLG